MERSGKIFNVEGWKTGTEGTRRGAWGRKIWSSGNQERGEEEWGAGEECGRLENGNGRDEAGAWGRKIWNSGNQERGEEEWGAGEECGRLENGNGRDEAGASGRKIWNSGNQERTGVGGIVPDFLSSRFKISWETTG
jgi:hypothetical protein